MSSREDRLEFTFISGKFPWGQFSQSGLLSYWYKHACTEIHSQLAWFGAGDCTVGLLRHKSHRVAQKQLEK